MVLVLTGVVAVLVVGIGLGFLLGKKVSTWCVRCGDPVPPAVAALGVNPLVDPPSARRGQS